MRKKDERLAHGLVPAWREYMDKICDAHRKINNIDCIYAYNVIG
jgi:hypothetical protein